jgi:hypothetical protein
MQNVPVTNYHDLSTQKNSESRGKKPTRKKLVREVFDHRYFIEGNVVKIS